MGDREEFYSVEDEGICVCCGMAKSEEEMDAGHDFCFDCFVEHQE